MWCPAFLPGWLAASQPAAAQRFNNAQGTSVTCPATNLFTIAWFQTATVQFAVWNHAMVNRFIAGPNDSTRPANMGSYQAVLFIGSNRHKYLAGGVDAAYLLLAAMWYTAAMHG